MAALILHGVGFLATADAYQKKDFEDLNLYIEKLVRDLQLPGCVLAVFDTKEILLQLEIGLADVERGSAMNARTLFHMGITTVAASSLLAAILEKDTKTFDAAAQSFDPAFKLSNPNFANKCRLFHLLSMTAGLPRYADEILDLNWSLPEDIFSVVGQAPLSARPGKIFDYSLLSVAAAGYLMGKRQDLRRPVYESYTQLLREKVLQPLNMERATFSIALEENNVAVGHTYEKHKWKKASAWEPKVHPLAPALGLKMCLEDLIKWLRFEMTLGENLGGKLANSEDLRRRWMPSKSNTFGMGWHNTYYQGSVIISTSGVQGHQSVMMGFFPFQQIGFAILLNTDHARGRKIFQELPLSLAEIMAEKGSQREK